MDRQTHLICETAQYITLDVWPTIYGFRNRYDQDSREVMMTIREWAEEFETWWQSHDEDWQDATDYLTELDEFADRKAKEYVKNLSNKVWN